MYTAAELRALVAYADARGVTVIPELEGPGHSGAMRRAMPALFQGEVRGSPAPTTALSFAFSALGPP